MISNIVGNAENASAFSVYSAVEIMTSAIVMFAERRISSSHAGIGTIISTTSITEAPAIRIGVKFVSRWTMVWRGAVAGAWEAIRRSSFS